MDKTDFPREKRSSQRERLGQENGRMKGQKRMRENGKCRGMTSPDASYSCLVTMGTEG